MGGGRTRAEREWMRGVSRSEGGGIRQERVEPRRQSDAITYTHMYPYYIHTYIPRTLHANPPHTHAHTHTTQPTTHLHAHAAQHTHTHPHTHTHTQARAEEGRRHTNMHVEP